MAGTLETVYTTIVTESMKGYQNITLTNWTNVAEPAINQGGRIEISGSLFSFPGNESVDASANWGGFGNDTQIYCYYLVGGGGTTVTCELTITAPTWQEEKGAWYDTATDTNRFWGKIYKDSGGNYAQKEIYLNRDMLVTNTGISLNTGANADHLIRVATDASILWDESDDEFEFDKPINMPTAPATDRDRRIYFASDASILWDESDDEFEIDKRSRIKSISAIRFTDTSTTENEIFDELNNYIPTTGDDIQLSGAGEDDTNNSNIVLTSARRASATVIIIYGFDITLQQSWNHNCDNGDATVVFTNVSLSYDGY